MLYSLLTSFIDQFSFLNVFRYLTFRTGLSLISSMIIVLMIGGPFIKYFSQKKITEPINLGCGDGVSIKELVETIVEVYGNEVSIEWDKSKPNGDPIRLMNTERANNYGFFPKVELRDGIREVMNYYDEIYSISK